MKFFDKLVLKIFSIIIFILALGIVLVMTGILPLETVVNEAIVLTDGENAIKALIIVLAVLMLLAIKGLFFTSKTETNSKEGIILENSNGKLVISKESLENLIASVTKDIPGADTIASRTVLDKDRNLIVYVTVVVSKDVMLKDISNELQNKIKDAMQKTADLDVKEVNIKVKNITSKKVKGLPAPTDDEGNGEDNTDSNSDNEENNDAQESNNQEGEE